MQRISLFTSLIILIVSLTLQARIKESEVERYRNIFISKIIKDNPGREKEIRNFLDGIVKSGSGGSGVADKFALFMYDSSVNRLTSEKIKFSRFGNSTEVFIVLKDESDGTFYNLYLEYIYSKAGDSYSLGDIYFSMIFTERIDSVRAFFEGE